MFQGLIYILKYRLSSESLWHTEYHETLNDAMMAERSLLMVDAASAHLFTHSQSTRLEVRIAAYAFKETVTTSAVGTSEV